LTLRRFGYIINLMKNPVSIKYLIPVLAACLLCGGCAHYSTDLWAIPGRSIKDLEQVRDQGVTKEVPLPYNEAYDKVLQILRDKKLTIFMEDRGRGYIVAMGFHKQVDTTRVGIFFEQSSETSTTVTLSSLSSTALAKADAIILGNL